MSDLMIVVTLLSIPVFLLGMIKPGIFGAGRKRVALIAVGMLVGGFAGFMATSDPAEIQQRAAERAARPPPTSPAPTPVATAVPARPAPPPRPADQEAFLRSLEAAAARYRAATNDMARGGERPIRAQELCRIMASNQVRGWVGTVHAMSSTNSGDGVLMIRLDRRTAVGTWNNSISDVLDKTLIPNGSAVYNAAVQLRTGQTVIFDGAFIPAREDCFREMSLTVHGAMTDPEFAFRFSAIRAAP